ncbi:MAG TPA: acyl-CoA thioesterase/bile acid-CoA:amino acid N-acyltransferase family protein [Ktedonobacteraceae bacterium]|nr:acyl-CoA thioesterase/bile acid-CoA:amino acid N-acyltransferase family protein [Ktedonobacteraceae bacterium]
MMEISKNVATTAILSVTPDISLIDEQVSIRLSNLSPGAPVTIRVETQDGSLRKWSSNATFVADSHGCVDVSTQEPIDGTYSGIDAMGFFWSMIPQETKRPTFFVKSKPTPLTVNLTAEVNGTEVASKSIKRVFAAQGVAEVPLRDEGLVGTLFLPADPAPHPAVIVLNGSDGGMHENAAALLASRGYAALALAYFGLEDLPGELVNIPLEYFEKAVHWLQNQERVVPQKIAVIGLSRGGELALLLGATIPAIRAVIAGSPSAIVYGGVKSNSSDFSLPSWTYHGEPLPYVPYKPNFFGMVLFWGKWLSRRPFASTPAFLKTLKRSKQVADATIPVENIQGPVLLLSGQEDQLWPSAVFAELVMDRLRRHDHPYPYRHLSYAGAGHFVCFPYGLPSLPPMITLSPMPGMLIAFGGTPAMQAAAAADSWQQILTFLKESLYADL